ncbi:MAG: hypothetical protein HQL96_08415 [Magnetococcales bacterium]|nr:hypothetical protein [Magnetococcales bacterium]
MNRKTVLALFGVMLIAYLIGLVILLPMERVEGWLREATGNRMSWRALTMGWDGVTLEEIRVHPPLFSQDKPIERLAVRPRPWPLLLGRIGMDYRLNFETVAAVGEATWNGRAGRLEWQATIGDLAQVMGLWLGPMGAQIQGRGEGNGWLSGVNDASPAMDGGSWEMVLRDVVAFGARMDPCTLTAAVKEKDAMEIRLAGKGEIALTGQVTLRMNWSDPRTSRIQGELRVQPIKPNPGGLMGQALARGQPLALTIAGTLDNPQWRMP